MYVAPDQTPGYACNFVVVDMVGDRGATGESLICVTVLAPMRK